MKCSFFNIDSYVNLNILQLSCKYSLLSLSYLITNVTYKVLDILIYYGICLVLTLLVGSLSSSNKGVTLLMKNYKYEEDFKILRNT